MGRMFWALLLAISVSTSFACVRAVQPEPVRSTLVASAAYTADEMGAAGTAVKDRRKRTSDFRDDLGLIAEECGCEGPYVVEVDRPCLLSASRTFGSGVYFECEPGAVIVVGDGQTLTINSPSHLGCPDRQKIFALSGTGAVAFTNGGTLYPGWWGAAGDGATDDSGPIQAAIDAGTNGATIFYPPGVYLLGTPLNPKVRQHLGSHCAASILQAGPYNGDAIFKFASMRGQMFVNLGFRSANREAYAFKSISLTSYTDSVLWRDCDFYNDFHTDVSALLANCLFDRCWFGYLGNGPYQVHRHVYSGDVTGTKATFTNTFRQCWFLDSAGTDASVHFVSGNTLLFQSCIWQSCGTPALKAEGVMNVLFENCNWEGVEPSLVDSGNCVIRMDADPVTGAVGRLSLRHCWFQNNGKQNGRPWTAVAKLSTSGGDAKAVFDSCAGNLGGYWTLSGSKYDLPANTTVTNSNCVNLSGRGGLFGQTYSVGPTIRVNNPVPFSVSDANALSAMTSVRLHRSTENASESEPSIRSVSADTRAFDAWGLHIIDSSKGAVSGTLADGMMMGQRVKFVCKAAGNDIDIEVSHHATSDPEVIRLDAAKEWIELVWDGTDWVETGGLGQTYP
jgi:hypothetical protein